MTDEQPIYDENEMKQKPIYPTEQTPSYADWKLFEMGKKLEEKVNEGGGGGTEYTAGSGINITSENVIENIALPDVTKQYVDTALAGKQDGLTSGSGIDITNNVISVNIGSANSGKYLKVDSNGNLTVVNISEENWIFTLADTTTITRTVLIKSS